jgi:hypothetical protein
VPTAPGVEAMGSTGNDVCEPRSDPRSVVIAALGSATPLQKRLIRRNCQYN